MAHYAKISNEEFTVSERARLQEAQKERSEIIASNISSEEYATLKITYDNLFTSDTLKNLEGELEALNSQYIPGISEEEKTALDVSVAEKQAEIEAEKTSLASKQEAALANLTAKKFDGTEALTTEIESLNTTISNSISRVIDVYSGPDEIEMVSADHSTLEAEIKVLQESKKDYSYNPATEEPSSELVDIEIEIQKKLKEIAETPLVEKDNTVYWEGYIGSSKRTSYNNNIRKNFAGVGMIYDPVRDAFYEEQPYESWTLDEDTCVWQPPTPKPDDKYFWKDDTTEWVDYVYFNPDKNQPYPSWTWNTETGVWEPP
ncbi:MAG: hypothetical protein VYC40_05390, partial [Pseudomonadota bacterium]|nr:hypothetical protein [Pseudomonadota bacterium]